MGTRGFTGFVIENTVKASYQQFDSYPSGVGATVLAFARSINETNIIDFRKGVAKIKLVDENKKPTAAQAAKLAQYTDIRVSTGEDWYSTLRNNQGNPAGMIDAGFMTDMQDFAEDSLFCEYGYLINLDNLTFEAYRGFRTEPSKGRFGDKVPAKPADWTPKYVGQEFYFPVEEFGVWRLDSLPTQEAFEAASLTEAELAEFALEAAK